MSATLVVSLGDLGQCCNAYSTLAQDLMIFWVFLIYSIVLVLGFTHSFSRNFFFVVLSSICFTTFSFNTAH